ncbi:URC4/urg3 family protein [Mycobacterium sp. BMJ-28]
MSDPVAELRTTAAVRERARFLLARARAGESPWFTVDDDALPATAAEVAAVTRGRYPDLEVPFHSRWRHFEAGGVDRRADLDVRSMIDVTVISVLLDAGAGPHWRYAENASGMSFTRSEGLGVASWHAFTAGLFSSDPDEPMRADAGALRTVTAELLADAFQVTPNNPLIGLEGRAALLRRLGDVMSGNSGVFGPDSRPGAMFDVLVGPDKTVSAHAILSWLLASLSGIWLTGNMIGDDPLGDCWPHPAVPGRGASAGWMPFHKLSQWLTYSLLEPFGWSGVTVTGIDELTGLPEYRNGGLLLDTGVLGLRDPAAAHRRWAVGDELVVEWRALTVALLDELAPLVRTELGAEVPLACVLEGGTWQAGRAAASRLRDGLPPLTIISDGTVF